MSDTFAGTRRAGSRPPGWPLVLSLLGVLVSVLLAFVWQASTSPVLQHGAGWVAGAFLPMTSLVCYRLMVRKRRTRPDFSFTRLGNRAIVGLALAGVVVGAYHGRFVALWLAS